MLVKERETKNEVQTGVWDPTTVSPDVFAGVWIKKEFRVGGVDVMCEGQVVSHDVDMLGNRIYLIRYLDGDEEDMFLEELVLFLRADEVLLRL